MRWRFCGLLLLAPLAMQGQAIGITPRWVRASGEEVVSAVPDRAKVSVGVVTQAATAQEAAAQNATQVEAVLAQLRLLLGVADADPLRSRATVTVEFELAPQAALLNPPAGGPGGTPGTSSARRG